MTGNTVSFGREVASYLIRIIFTILTVIIILSLVSVWYKDEAVSDGVCNIAVIPLQGVILPYGEALSFYSDVITPKNVREQVEKAEADRFIKGILFEVDSPGGTPVASLKINEIIKEITLPTVGLVGDVGASGAYLALVATDRILASSMSRVGSIGVTMSYTENSKRNEEKGITYVQLSTGEFKDAGSPEKPLTEEERKKFEGELQQIHDEFVSEVAKARNLSLEKVQLLADGSTFIGRKAEAVGLIDGVGGKQEVREEFSKVLGLSPDEVVLCKLTNSTFSL